MREKLDFNENWLFHKGDIKNNTPSNKGYSYMTAKTQRMHIGPASPMYYAEPDSFDDNVLYTDDRWNKISIPHDFIIGGTPKETNNNALGFFDYDNGWYIKRFTLNNADKNKRLTLYFEGVATECTVYLNGCILHRSFSGYTPFEVDITDYVIFEKENHLAVYVNTEQHEGWWYSGGGIYRPVYLIKTDLLNIDLYGIYVKPIKTNESDWDVFAEITVRNDYCLDKSADINLNILSSSGKIIASGQQTAVIEKKDKRVVKLKLSVNNPSLWSPETPNLYYAQASISQNGSILDMYSVHFGFRTFHVDPEKGFFINDKRYKIKGFCGHADCGLTGKAVSNNIHRYKVQLLKEMGANGYRTSHYPQSEVLMDELDKNGFIVMDEARWFGSSQENLQQLEILIKRDRNRPSVFFWSLGNEELYHAKEEGLRICKTMTALARKLDDTRLIMTAVNLPDDATVYEENDVIGINYCWDSYERVHKKFPNKGLFSSECCATGTTRGWYFDDNDERGYISAYDHDINDGFRSREFNYKFIMNNDWILGGYQWIAFEHRGEAVWPRLCSQSGAIDLYMQKKDAFYQNKSFFTDAPMVHILPHWNFKGLENEPIKVCAYTNTCSVELFLNNKSLGKQSVERYSHAEWIVPYEIGEIKVNAYNENGDIVATDKRITSENPYKLVLKQDTFDVYANGKDLAIFTCYTVDKNGNEVYDAEIPKVSFFTSGDCKVYSTGSDISDHDSIFNSVRRMRAGRISIAVKLGKTPENLKLFASSNGLISACAEIKVH